jgi:trk system potassium uptake protein TrkH
MLIAGAPMSTSGGVKTATIGIILIFSYSFLRGRYEASFGGRRLSATLLTKAVTLLVCYLVILFFGFFSLNFTETATSFELFFEALSALSVCGFSLGITPHLSDFGKGVIIILMMLGRIGILTGLYAMLQDRRQERYRYPIGDFYVG